MCSLAKDHVKCCKDKGVSGDCLGHCKTPMSQQKSQLIHNLDFPPSPCDQFIDEIYECLEPGNDAWLII